MAFFGNIGTAPPQSSQPQLYGQAQQPQNSLTAALSNQIRNSLWREAMAPGGEMKPAPTRVVTNYMVGDPNAEGRTPAMVSAGTNNTQRPASSGSGSTVGGGGFSSSSSSASSASRPASGSSSPLPAFNTLGVPDDPRINNLIGRIDGFANLDPNGINARVAALMAPQEAMAQRQINSGVTNALSAQGVLPTGGLAEKMRADISAPIFERLALARNDAMDRYTNQGIDASRGLLSSLVALQEAQRNQRLSEAELGIRREDLGLRRDEAQRQAARDALQNQSLQQQMEMARLQLQQARNPYRPDQVNYLNASAPGGLQSGSGGSAGAAGVTIGGISSGPPQSGSIGAPNNNQIFDASMNGGRGGYRPMTQADVVGGPTPSARGQWEAQQRAGGGGSAASAIQGLIPTTGRVGFSPTDPLGGMPGSGGGSGLGAIWSGASGSGALVSPSFNPNLASQGVGAGGAYNSANWARSAADMAAAAARF